MFSPGACLEAQAHPQTDGPAIINTLVLIALIELSEKRVEFDIRNRLELGGNWVNLQKERADVSEIEHGVRVSRCP